MTFRENLRPRQVGRALALATLVLAGAAGVWAVGEHSPANLARAILAIGGAGLVAWWSTRRPVVAFGVLFLLASLSRWTIQLPPGHMRLEQPAIAAGLVAMLYARRVPDPATLRLLRPVAIAFAVYLGALTASSLLYSPDRADSLRMVFWTGLSMAGGLLAFLLLFGADPQRGSAWLRLTAAGHGAVGIIVAVSFFVLGPVILAGSDPVPGMAGKIYGLSWEANIFASLLAALSFFAIEEFRARPRPSSATLVAVVLLGIAVALTRGAYLGLAAGLALYLVVVLYRMRRPLGLLIPATVVVAATALGFLVAPALLADRIGPFQPPIDLTAPGWGRSFAVGSDLLPALPGHPLAGVLRVDSVPPAGPPQPPTPPIIPPVINDTLQFRLDRIPQAIEDWRQNPIIGVGSNSFGQRHLDPTQIRVPDHIAILAVAALYESGLVGAAGLTIGFALILLAIWRASRRSATAPMAAAYLGSIVSLLVAYQATNALNFSLIWLISGAGLALAFSATARVEDLSVSPKRS
jgi:hypothetical protein